MSPKLATKCSERARTCSCVKPKVGSIEPADAAVVEAAPERTCWSSSSDDAADGDDDDDAEQAPGPAAAAAPEPCSVSSADL